MSERQPFLRAAGIVGIITLFSRCLGLVRDMVLAALFGASRLGDVFLIAFELPNLARRILGEGSLSAFIVPIFTQVRKEQGTDAGWRFASNALTTLGIATFGLTLVGIFAAEPLFSLFGYGYVERGDTEAILLGTLLTRIMFPFLMLLALSSILMGLCHGVRHFSTPALGSVMLNLSMIGTGLLLWRHGQVAIIARHMALAVLLGAMLRIVIMIGPLARAGFRYRPRLRPDSPHMRELYLMLLPALYGLAVVQINITVSRAFATWLGEGFVPCLVFSNRLVQLPLAIVASALATAILPQISQYWVEKRHEDLRDVAGFAFRISCILFMPAAAGLLFLGEPVITMLFERRNWTPEDTANTYQALFFYAPGLVAWGALRILTPIYYAQKDVRTPVLCATVAMLLNVALNVLLLAVAPLRQNLGHGGLALANTIGVLVHTALLFYILKKRGLPLWDKALTVTLGKTALAAGAMGLSGWAFWQWLEPRLPALQALHTAALLATIAALAALYFAIAFFLRVEDLQAAGRILLRRRRKS